MDVQNSFSTDVAYTDDQVNWVISKTADKIAFLYRHKGLPRPAWLDGDGETLLLSEVHAPLGVGLLSSKVAVGENVGSTPDGFGFSLFGGLGGGLQFGVSDGQAEPTIHDVLVFTDVTFTEDTSGGTPDQEGIFYIPGTINMELQAVDLESFDYSNADALPDDIKIYQGNVAFKASKEGVITPVFQDNPTVPPSIADGGDEVLQALQRATTSMLPSMVSCLPALAGGPKPFLTTLGSVLAPQLVDSAIEIFGAAFKDTAIDGKLSTQYTTLSWEEDTVLGRIADVSERHSAILGSSDPTRSADDDNSNLVCSTNALTSYGNQNSGMVLGQAASLIDNVAGAKNGYKLVTNWHGDTVGMGVDLEMNVIVSSPTDGDAGDIAIFTATPHDLFGLDPAMPITFTASLGDSEARLLEVISPGSASQCIVQSLSGPALAALSATISETGITDVKTLLTTLGQNLASSGGEAVSNMLNNCLVKQLS